MELHSNYILASPDNKRLLLWVNGYRTEGSRAVLPTVELYDLNTGGKLAKIPKSGTPIGFSPDGQTFLVAGANEEKPLTQLLQLDSFRVYRSDSGEPVGTLDLEHGLVRNTTPKVLRQSDLGSTGPSPQSGTRCMPDSLNSTDDRDLQFKAFVSCQHRLQIID